MDELLARFQTEGFEATLGRFYSSYRAFVFTNEDPKGMNRLLLLVPFYSMDEPLPYWAYSRGQKGGKDHGFIDLPEKGDMVWVSFENGDPSAPIWEHYSYGEGELPDEFETTKHRGYKTPAGTLILINDNKGEEEVLVRLNSKTDWIKINKDVIELESKLIKLGENQEEHALMGDTTKVKLEKLCDNLINFMQQFETHIHNTPFGPTSPPTNSAAVANIRSNVNTLKNSLEEILSNKVSIDK